MEFMTSPAAIWIPGAAVTAVANLAKGRDLYLG